MKKLTHDHIKAIAAAIGAHWQGDQLCVADWRTVLEHGVFEGFDVTANLAKLNAQLPEGIEPIALESLEEKQSILDEIDRYVTGGNHRAWFENQRRLVQDALAKI